MLIEAKRPKMKHGISLKKIMIIKIKNRKKIIRQKNIL